MDNSDTCVFCENVDDASICSKVHTGPPMYICTRAEGHSGQHVACGLSKHLEHPIYMWDNE